MQKIELLLSLSLPFCSKILVTSRENHFLNLATDFKPCFCCAWKKSNRGEVINYAL